MLTLRTSPKAPLMSLFAVTMVLSLGCDEAADRDGLENRADVLELSPSQDFVDGYDGLAFEAIESSGFASDAADPEVQPFGADCTLLRPVWWSSPHATCVEYYKPPHKPADTLEMDHGDSFITTAGFSGGGLGSGDARITCTNGQISIQTISCVTDIIPIE